jgi:TusA-related sulfurtransferase
MPVYVIDQWVDTRAFAHDDAVRRTAEVVRGLASGQVAEVVVDDPESASDIAEASENRLLELVDASHLDRDTIRLIIRHR